MQHRYIIGYISFIFKNIFQWKNLLLQNGPLIDVLIQGWKLNSEQAETFKGDTTSLKTVRTSLYYFHNIQICPSATIYITQALRKTTQMQVLRFRCKSERNVFCFCCSRSINTLLSFTTRHKLNPNH